jgi:hypothetical protein
MSKPTLVTNLHSAKPAPTPHEQHIQKLMMVVEAQRFALVDILARIDHGQDVDPELFCNLSTLADNARLVEAVAAELRGGE